LLFFFSDFSPLVNRSLAPLFRSLTKLLLTAHPLPPALQLELAQPLHGGTALLTARLVLLLPCPEDGTCVASLLLRAQHLPLLRHVYRSWPGLSLPPQRSEFEEAKVAVLMGRAHMFGRDISTPFAAQSQSHSKSFSQSLSSQPSALTQQEHAFQASLDTLQRLHEEYPAPGHHSAGFAGTARTSQLLQTRPHDMLSSSYHLTAADSTDAAVLAADVDAQLDHLLWADADAEGNIETRQVPGTQGSKVGIESGGVDWNSPLDLRVKLMLPLAALRRSGLFADDSILAAGYRPLELKGQGFSAEQLRRGGYTAGNCRALGMTVVQLLQGGFPPAAIVQMGGFTHNELRHGSIDIQRHVLMGLFDAMHGRRWKKSTNWGTAR